MGSSDVQELDNAFGAAERDARAVVDGLTEALGTWRAQPGTWSVAECLDHLAIGNRLYLGAMEPAARRAHAGGRLRRRPAEPGPIGRWFVGMLEPPVKPRIRMKAPGAIRPRPSPSLQDAATQFLESNAAVRAFLLTYAEIDLAGVRFRNPFIPVVFFSLATGLHVLAAHERRHLVQAWRVRHEAMAASRDRGA